MIKTNTIFSYGYKFRVFSHESIEYTDAAIVIVDTGNYLQGMPYLYRCSCAQRSISLILGLI